MKYLTANNNNDDEGNLWVLQSITYETLDGFQMGYKICTFEDQSQKRSRHRESEWYHHTLYLSHKPLHHTKGLRQTISGGNDNDKDVGYLWKQCRVFQTIYKCLNS